MTEVRGCCKNARVSVSKKPRETDGVYSVEIMNSGIELFYGILACRWMELFGLEVMSSRMYQSVFGGQPFACRAPSYPRTIRRPPKPAHNGRNHPLIPAYRPSGLTLRFNCLWD
jgi:hypothetical protein